MWKAVAKVSEVSPESARVVQAGALTLALLYGKDGLFAIDNVCPHSGGAIGEGLVQGNTVTCPLHGWQFDGKTGACLSAKRPNQRQYAVKIEGGDVLVEVPEPTAPATAKKEPFREWAPVASVADLRPGSMLRAQVDGLTVALACTADGVMAFENACPHEGGLLAEGALEGNTITCPLHGWKFDCKTGQGLTDARRPLRTYETKTEQGKVWVRLAAAPAEEPEEAVADPATKKSSVEQWKMAKHGMDVWPDVERYAAAKTPMAGIEEPELERMKWYGYFYRKNNDMDHYMSRVRIPGCELTAAQARTVAQIAREWGYGIVDVTTRGNLQVQGLTIERLPAVREALDRAGLTARQTGHDNVRNVTSHPHSGLDPEELIDTRDLARQIQDLIVASREFSDLPRKFNIALTGRTDPAGHAWTQDICFVAARGPDGRVGFQLLLGGNQGQSPHLSWHAQVLVKPTQVVEVTGAILRTFRELGYRHNRHHVRFRYLVERLGLEQVLVEVEKRLGYAMERYPIAPPKPTAEEDFIGWFGQKQEGLWAVGVCVPLGRLTSDQVDGLAGIAERHGDGTLRTTYDQNLVLPGVMTASKSAMAYGLARHGLTAEPDPVARNVVACTGKQFCNLAVTETKGHAYQLMEALRRRKVQLHGIHVNMSGCPSSCGMTHTGDIGLKGTRVRWQGNVVDAFDVYLGGGLAQNVQLGILYQKGVPAHQLPETVERLTAQFYRERQGEQTFSQYWREKLQGHKPGIVKDELAAWKCGGCGYLHVAQDPPQFCPVCSALRAKFDLAPAGVASPATAKPPAGARRGRPDAAALPAGTTPPALWVCGSCGLKHKGEEAPDLCPVCGVKKAEFRPAGIGAANGAVAVKPKPMPAGKRIVIVGGGIAGHTAAQTARSLDPHARITLLTDERHSFYNRLNLTRFLAQEVQRPELFDYAADWYQEHGVEVVTETRVAALDASKKTLALAGGRELSYAACVLAHGSSASTPPFYRSGLPGVRLLRTLEDVEGIIEAARPGSNVAVIGGGVLGLEAAYGLVKRGASGRIFEYAPYLMPRQLDRTSAALFTAMVEEKGIECLAGVGVKAIIGPDRAEGVGLADGRSFPADLVVVSTGIRPNADWVASSGIKCNRGVLVDDRMQTSAEGVFAAGDVVEWRGQVVGLWTNAIEQAKVAGANAAGRMGLFQGFLPVTILKCLGIPLVSIGEIKEDGGGISSRTKYDPLARSYRRVVFRTGAPIGGILLGTSGGMGEMRKLIESGIEMEKLRDRVMPEEPVAAPVG